MKYIIILVCLMIVPTFVFDSAAKKQIGAPKGLKIMTVKPQREVKQIEWRCVFCQRTPEEGMSKSCNAPDGDGHLYQKVTR